jgi:hypothetical protein
MTYASSQNAVCFDDLKSAALYFDSVIPISFRSMHGRGKDKDVLFKLPEDIPGEALLNLLFNNITYKNSGERWTHLGRYIDAWDDFMKKIDPARAKHINSEYDDYGDVKKLYLDDVTLGANSSVRQEFKNFARKLGKPYSTVLLPTDHNGAEGAPYGALVLSGLSLVDTSKASWEQIIEFRKDIDARNKLRNLRLFFHNTYEGKASSYVVDDLARRIDEYDIARKRMGFEAVTGTISALLDAKSLQAAAATGIAATFIGGPLTGISSAVFVELGNMALTFARQRFSMKDFENSHDLAYLIEVKNNFAK